MNMKLNVVIATGALLAFMAAPAMAQRVGGVDLGELTKGVLSSGTTSVGNAGSNSAGNGIGNEGSERCINGVATVSGTGNVVRISGFCAVLRVDGTGNVAQIDRVGSIQLRGTGNSVEYRYLNPRSQGSRTMVHPTKSGTGIGNDVSWTRGAPFEDEN